MFTTNEAPWDRVLRIVLGGLLLYVGWTGIVTGGLGVFLKYFGFVPLVTALIGWCPLYVLLGISTKRKAAAA